MIDCMDGVGELVEDVTGMEEERECSVRESTAVVVEMMLIRVFRERVSE